MHYKQWLQIIKRQLVRVYKTTKQQIAWEMLENQPIKKPIKINAERNNAAVVAINKIKRLI